MKIAVLHSIFKPYFRGGAEVVVENIVHGLQKDHDVFVVTLGHEDKMEEIDNARVFRIKPFNVFNFLDINSKPVFLRLLWHAIDMFNSVQAGKIFRILEKEKPDLVLTHSLKGLGYRIPSVLRKMKIRNIHTVHDMQLIHPSCLLPRRKSFFAWKYRLFTRFLFGSPDAVVFPSEYIRKIHEKFRFFPRSKRVVLGNPIKQISEVRKSDNTFRILFLGQVEEYKGILDLIDAVKAFEGKIGLEVVGDGKALLKAKNRALGSPQIRFWGRMDHVQLEKDIWPRIDVLVNPSKVEESFGMVVVEAFSRGIPVLVSSLGALPELVDGDVGWVFKDDLKEKLEFILENREKVLLMKNDCLKKAESYLIDPYLEKLLG